MLARGSHAARTRLVRGSALPMLRRAMTAAAPAWPNGDAPTIGPRAVRAGPVQIHEMNHKRPPVAVRQSIN